MLSQSLYEEIILKSPQAIILTDEGDIIRYQNPAAVALFGVDAVNSPLNDFISGVTSAIFSHSTGVFLSSGTGSEICTLTDHKGNKHTTAVYKNRHENRTIIFLKDISTETAYWEKLHRHKKTEDELYRSAAIRNGNLEEAIREIMVKASETMRVERCNIWQIDSSFQTIRSIGNYDRSKGFLPNATLSRWEMPAYFDLLATEELITTIDSKNDTRTRELSDSYIIPNGICSMMDVPVRIEGRMVGLICFEETKNIRNWDVAEQKFGLTIAQIIALTLETHARQQFKAQLEAALEEKKVLLREVNHRVKNNFELISGVLRLQADTTSNQETRLALETCRDRLTGMANIHRLFYQGEHNGIVSLRDFIMDICSHFKTIYTADQIDLNTLLDPVQLSISKSLLVGIIINELLANAQKHAFALQQKKTVSVQLQHLGNAALITVSDNGNGGDSGKTTQTLTEELVTRLNGTITTTTSNGYTCKIRFPIK